MSLQSEVQIREMKVELESLKQKVRLLVAQVDDLSSRLVPVRILGKRKPTAPMSKQNGNG